MLKTNSPEPVKNNWLTLALAALSFAVIVGLPTSSMPVLFKEIAAGLNLSVVQIGTVWGIISMGSILVVPVGGILCDKLGAKRVILLSGVASGITGALRGLSGGVVALMVTTFFWGLIISAIMPAITMAASQSTGNQKQGSAQGYLAVGGGIGFITGSLVSATWISPLLGGWRNVFFVYGGIAVLVSLFWLFFKESPKSEKLVDAPGSLPLRRVFVLLLQNRDLLLLGLALLAYQGCVFGMQGFLPYSLQENGWAVAAAGGALAVFNTAGTLGAVPLTMLSDRLKSRKFCLYLSFAFAIVCVGLISVVQNWVLWILVALVGLFSMMNSALCAAMSIETVPRGSSYSGTALGLVLGFGLIGRSFAPPIGNSFAGIKGSVEWPFIFWAALAVAGILILSLIKEAAWADRKVKSPALNGLIEKVKNT